MSALTASILNVITGLSTQGVPVTTDDVLDLTGEDENSVVVTLHDLAESGIVTRDDDGDWALVDDAAYDAALLEERELRMAFGEFAAW